MVFVVGAVALFVLICVLSAQRRGERLTSYSPYAVPSVFEGDDNNAPTPQQIQQSSIVWNVHRDPNYIKTHFPGGIIGAETLNDPTLKLPTFVRYGPPPNLQTGPIQPPSSGQDSSPSIWQRLEGLAAMIPW